MRCGAITLSVAGIALLSMSVGVRADLYPGGWNSPGVISAPDPLGDAANPGVSSQDIVCVWFAEDATHYYFRLDIASVPSSNPENFSPVYGVHLDTIDNSGGGYATESYVPVALTGIDYILDGHYDPTLFVGGWGPSHYHAWNYYGSSFGAAALSPDYGTFAHTLNGGSSLEWMVARSAIGGPLDPSRIWFATNDISLSPTRTHDLAQLPEPTTLLLVACATGLAAVRRRNTC